MQHKKTRFTTIEQAKESLKNEIDLAAGAARDRYITTTQGQEAVYIEKMRQAYLYIETSPTDMDGFEYIKAEADEAGKTYLETAERIASVANSWNKLLSPQIEAKRMKAKDDIDALTLNSEIDTAVLIAYAAKQAIMLI